MRKTAVLALAVFALIVAGIALRAPAYKWWFYRYASAQQVLAATDDTSQSRPAVAAQIDGVVLRPRGSMLELRHEDVFLTNCALATLDLAPGLIFVEGTESSYSLIRLSKGKTVWAIAVGPFRDNSEWRSWKGEGPAHADGVLQRDHQSYVTVLLRGIPWTYADLSCVRLDYAAVVDLDTGRILAERTDGLVGD